MSLRHDPTDPEDMSPEDRLAEVAAILAEGVLRLRRHRVRAYEESWLRGFFELQVLGK